MPWEQSHLYTQSTQNCNVHANGIETAHRYARHICIEARFSNFTKSLLFLSEFTFRGLCHYRLYIFYVYSTTLFLFWVFQRAHAHLHTCTVNRIWCMVIIWKSKRECEWANRSNEWALLKMGMRCYFWESALRSASDAINRAVLFLRNVPPQI